MTSRARTPERHALVWRRVDREHTRRLPPERRPTAATRGQIPNRRHLCSPQPPRALSHVRQVGPQRERTPRTRTAGYGTRASGGRRPSSSWRARSGSPRRRTGGATRCGAQPRATASHLPPRCAVRRAAAPATWRAGAGPRLLVPPRSRWRDCRILADRRQRGQYLRGAATAAAAHCSTAAPAFGEEATGAAHRSPHIDGNGGSLTASPAPPHDRNSDICHLAPFPSSHPGA